MKHIYFVQWGKDTFEETAVFYKMKDAITFTLNLECKRTRKIRITKREDKTMTPDRIIFNKDN